MSACSITLNGIDFSCKDSVGGIKRIWLSDWTEAAPSIDDNRYKATMTGFKLYRIRTGNGSMNSTLNADESAGTVYVTTDLNVRFTKLSEDSRNEVAEILKGNTAAIVEDNLGNYWGLGAEHPLTLSAGSINTGAAMADFAGYDITLQDYSTTLPYLLDESLISSLPQSVGEDSD